MDIEDPSSASSGHDSTTGETVQHSEEKAGGEPALAGRKRSLIETVFIGPAGVRAGWRLLAFVLIVFIFGFALEGARNLVPRSHWQRLGPANLLMGELLAFLAVLLATLVMGRVEKRRLADYGLPGRGAFSAKFWEGALWGFLALTVLLLIIQADHGFDFGSLALGTTEIVRYAIFWAIAFLVVGLFEEFSFRGYPLFTLATGIGFWPSAVLLSAAFGAVHLKNPGEDWSGGLAAAFISLFFCFTLRRTGSLWFAIGFHAAWDYAESFVYSVPDSGAMVSGHLLNSSFHGPHWLTGGSVGPEGSALVFVVIAALFAVFGRLHRGARFPIPSLASN